MNNPEPLVFIVDDDSSLRKALERLLTTVGIKVKCYETARDFLSHPPYKGPCCLVLDVRMPGLSGLDLQEELHKIGSVIPIIFITAHGTIPMSVRAMKSGAIEFLEKPFEDQILLDCIKHAIESDQKNKKHHLKRQELAQRFESLTPREQEVMAWVVSGMLNKQIALKLGICEKTVKVHRSRVMQKMLAKSLPDLVRFSELLDVPESEAIRIYER